MTNIKQSLYLEPKFLDQNIMNHLLNKINSEKCDSVYGYILSINRIIEIYNHTDTLFTIKFEAETYKPKINDKLTGVVCMMSKHGIFIDSKKKQKILIPYNNLKGYKFNLTLGVWGNKKNVIKIGSCDNRS